ncbi:hypothetical protein [Stenotrophomonas acidaminiphila]
MSTLRKSNNTAAKRTGSAFAGPPQHGPLTGERIAADLAAFGKAGGKIEVLGNTPLRGRTAAAKPTPTDRKDKVVAPTAGTPAGKT